MSLILSKVKGWKETKQKKKFFITSKDLSLQWEFETLKLAELWRDSNSQQYVEECIDTIVCIDAVSVTNELNTLEDLTKSWHDYLVGEIAGNSCPGVYKVENSFILLSQPGKFVVLISADEVLTPGETESDLKEYLDEELNGRSKGVKIQIEEFNEINDCLWEVHLDMYFC